MVKERQALKNIKNYVPGQEIAGNIKLASNENPLGPSPAAKKAVNRALGELAVYPDKECAVLKEKIAKQLGLSKENVAVGNGSDDLLFMIAAAYLEAGDEVVISKTTFSGYEFNSRLFGAEPVFVELKNWNYDLEAIWKAVTPKTKIVFLCNPNNPTGTIFYQNELDDFLAKLPASVMLVIDEAYCEYATHDHFPKSLKYLEQSFENVIILRTFSKIYGLAGLRVGYALAKMPVIASLNKVRQPFSVNRLAQIAASAAVNDSVFLKRSRKNNEQGKKYLYQELDKLKLSFVITEANFIFIDLKQDAAALYQRLTARGLTVRPLNSFGCSQAIRVTIGTPKQNSEFIKQLKQVL
ncbi:MAG: histidinol-phosphate transaminase [Candidatus Margulisiibacteriota bacterium]|jgi:histidinol-phosphate aminotransferase